MICPECGVDHHAPLSTPHHPVHDTPVPVTGYVTHEMISGRIAVLNGACKVPFIFAFETVQEAEDWIQSAAASDD